MTPNCFLQACLAGVCALALCGSVASAAPEETVTTVSPLIINALAPVPEIGDGATYFMPQELKDSAQAAHMEAFEARDSRNECRPTFAPRQREDLGDVSLEALYTSEYEAQIAMWRAGETAETVKQAAIAARAAAARGEGDTEVLKATELARQAAVKAFQTAQSLASEAHLRVADYQDLAQIDPDATDRELMVQINLRTLERENNMGVAGVYVPGVFADLRLSDIVVREQYEAGARVLRVTGKIVNTRRRPINVPPLWVAAVDRFGTSLKAQQMEAPIRAPKIAAHGSVPFVVTLAPKPDKSARAIVTFAPFHHQPPYLPAGLFCG